MSICPVTNDLNAYLTRTDISANEEQAIEALVKSKSMQMMEDSIGDICDGEVLGQLENLEDEWRDLVSINLPKTRNEMSLAQMLDLINCSFKFIKALEQKLIDSNEDEAREIVTAKYFEGE